MLKTTAKHCTGYSKWEYKCLYFIKKNTQSELFNSLTVQITLEFDR